MDEERTQGDTPEALAQEIEAWAKHYGSPDPALLREWARIIRQFVRKDGKGPMS